MTAPFEQAVTFLPVADLERSHEFYGDALGLELVLDQGACRIYRVAGEAFIGVCRRERPAPAGGVIVTLVSQDVDGWHERLAAAGVEVTKPAAYNPEYDIYHCFLHDPDGHVVEIQRFQAPEWPRPG